MVKALQELDLSYHRNESFQTAAGLGLGGWGFWMTAFLCSQVHMRQLGVDKHSGRDVHTQHYHTKSEAADGRDTKSWAGCV